MLPIHRFVHLFAVLLLIFFSVSSSGALKNANLRDATIRNHRKCTDERFNKMELTLARIMSFGKHGRPFPTTPQQLDLFCDEGRDMVNQVESFIRECIKKQIADVTVVLMYSIKGAFLRRYCGLGKKVKKEASGLMQMAPCLNTHLLPDDRCIMQYVNETKHLMNIAEEELKIPHACCNYVRSLSCLGKQIDEQPCMQSSREEILDLVRGLFQAISDIMCGEYTEYTDKCETLGPAPTPLTPNTRHYETFIWVLTDMLASMKNLHPARFRTGGKVPLSEFTRFLDAK